jgi:cytochrome c oxidase assembly protein subunit 15
MIPARFFFTRNTLVLAAFKQGVRSGRTLLGPQVVLSPPPTISSFFSTRGVRTLAPLAAWGRRAASTVNSAPASTRASTPHVEETPSKPNPSTQESPLATKLVGWWLVATSGLVFGIVVLGGLTRLTESGLSITEWRPVTGLIPPLSQQEWLAEFDKYKDLPEFKQLNLHITLDEFKFIFGMEWAHRLMGRAIGVLFVVPMAYFWSRGHLGLRALKGKLVGLTALLGLQGAIGWWMVRSGLDEEQLAERHSKPTVLQYRLTTHLGAAFAMYLGVLWTGFAVLQEHAWATQPGSRQAIAALSDPKLRPLRRAGFALLALTYLTALLGGMVAGLDAGLIYNTFPHMGDGWVPSRGELMLPVFSRAADGADLWWRNLLENPTTVQLVHRVLATTTFCLVLAMHVHAIRHKATVPRAAARMIHAAMGVALVQVLLGVLTLVYLVPTPLAAAHQAGALVLLTTVLAFCARLRRPRPNVARYLGAVRRL